MPPETQTPSAMPPDHERLCMAITQLLVGSKVGPVVAIGALTEVMAQLAISNGTAGGAAEMLRSVAGVLEEYAANRRLQ